MIALLASAAVAATVSLDRVELLADDPGTWLNVEAPLLVRRPGTASLRLVEQVQPTWRVGPVYVGTSLAGQSLALEGPLGAFRWAAGLETRLLLPRGAFGGLAWRRGHWQAGLGASLLSARSWANPSWSHWDLLPTVTVAWVRQPAKLPAVEARP